MRIHRHWTNFHAFWGRNWLWKFISFSLAKLAVDFFLKNNKKKIEFFLYYSVNVIIAVNFEEGGKTTVMLKKNSIWWRTCNFIHFQSKSIHKSSKVHNLQVHVLVLLVFKNSFHSTFIAFSLIPVLIFLFVSPIIWK